MEGGWANVKTQDTTITPQTIQASVKRLAEFERDFNEFLAKDQIPPVKIGEPVGSGTYYQRDLEQQPDKQYGDIDVQFIIPKLDGMTAAQNESLYFGKIKEYTAGDPSYDTTNGVNVIFTDGDQSIQVDFVAMFTDKVDWSRVFAPEWNMKGVLSSTLFSALAQLLNISMSSRGIQAKTRDGELVKFNVRKDTQLHNITDNAEIWGIDLAIFLGAQQISPRLNKFPGQMGETKITHIVQTIRGVLESLGREDQIDDVRDIYLSKIDAVINSSKFDKAQTDAAKRKAAETKKMLHDKSRIIAELFDR